MSEWISVKKRLPRKTKFFDCSKKVLVVDEFGDMVSAWYQYGGSYQETKQEEGYEIGWHSSFVMTTLKPLKGITRWMPLPEAPR